jgi:hypothetical protein|tara:strand:- start:129 stop:431 length:303 start_codon:yes stop_codon:yes gene_type:complete
LVKPSAQEYWLRIGESATDDHEWSWDAAGRPASYTVEYVTGLGRPQWRPLSAEIAWPIDTTSFKLPLVVGASTVFYCVKIDGANPHRDVSFAGSDLFKVN